ncbi:MAG: type I polyketide synthase, partial [Gammaproteobacteria bacterium]
LTVPHGPSQQAVIRQALVRAGLSPAEVSYVEAHGTGTALGDPIELHALAAVFGGERLAERPLVVGSVKTNIGHAEAAAGIAGLIKVVLALRHETIPANLHFHRPNPRVAWDQSPVTVPSAALPWPKGPEPRVAGVSSFGFGGTNAHLVVADPPTPFPRPAAPERPLHLLALSAQSDEALKTLAARYARYLAEHPEHALGDVCHTANAGRAHFRHRLGVAAGSVAELHTRLEAFAAEGTTAGLVQGKVNQAPPPVAFLFTGQGAQYAGMGRELYETQPGFRRDLDLCDGLSKRHLERPLLEVLYAADGALDATAYTQPALFALEYCLGRLWMSWGVVPDVLMGHSLGEYVAACLAGVFSLEDAIRLIAARARLMQQLPDDGAMVAVFASEAEVRSALWVLASDLEVAAINGPEHVVVSGRRAALDRVVEHFARQGVETRALKVSQAFHSALVEPMLEELERVAVGVSFSPPQLDIVSNVTGGLAGAELAEPGYWRRHARQPVRFCDGMRTLEEQGVGVFLEVGPHPVLLGMGRRCVSRLALTWLPSLRRGQRDWQAMLDTLAAVYVRGVPVDWRGFDAGYGRRKVRLPTYPFQRQRYWAAPAEACGTSPRPPATRDPRLHPLLGARWRHARQADDILFEGELSAGQPAFLDDHRVFGTAIMPASGYMDMALAAAAAALAPERMSLENLGFHRPLAFRDGETRIVQTSLRPNPSGGYALHIHSRSAAGAGEPAWALHASGTLRVEAGPEAAPRENLAALRGRMAEAEPAALYEAYACHGVAFGPAFRAVRELWRGQGEALARIVVPKDAEHGETYWLHPVWLDACAQVVGAAAPETGVTYLQARIRRVRVYQRPAGPAWSHAWVRPGMDGAVRIADVRLLDDAGEVLAEVSGLEAWPASAASLRPEGLALYQLRWLPQPRAAVSADCLPAPGSIAAALGPLLDEAMGDARLLAYGNALAGLDALTPFYVADAFRELGWVYRTGQRFSTGELLEALGIV